MFFEILQHFFIYLFTFSVPVHTVPESSMQTFPPANGGAAGRGYQTIGGPPGMIFFFLKCDCSFPSHGSCCIYEFGQPRKQTTFCLN